MGGYKEVLESAAKRIRSLERVQKGMLLFAAVLPLAFFAAYFMTTGAKDLNTETRSCPRKAAPTRVRTARCMLEQ